VRKGTTTTRPDVGAIPDKAMNTETEADRHQLVTTSLVRLSSAISRILSRFSSESTPTKLTLLNDLAEAIRPGSNWEALEAAMRPEAQEERRQAAAAEVAIPPAPRGARTLPARLWLIEDEAEQVRLRDLIEDSRPLFVLTHRGLPIVGLELQAYDGNGDLDVSFWPNLFVLKDGQVAYYTPHALGMEDEVARLAFGAVQNLTAAPFYSVFGQLDAASLRIILGPCAAAAAIPSSVGQAAPRDIATQSVRVIAAKDSPPDERELEILLALAGSAMPHLGVKGFGTLDGIVRLRISVPRHVTCSPVKMSLPDALGEYDSFWRNGGEGWSAADPRGLYSGIPGTIAEALDLALAVLNIDDPDLFLHAWVYPPSKKELNSRPEVGWRGGLFAGWRILRLRPGAPAESLSLPPEEWNRLELSLNGWTIREGLRVGDPGKDAIEFLILRGRRRHRTISRRCAPSPDRSIHSTPGPAASWSAALDRSKFGAYRRRH
jgi:hypothetical protein